MGKCKGYRKFHHRSGKERSTKDVKKISKGVIWFLWMAYKGYSVYRDLGGPTQWPF